MNLRAFLLALIALIFAAPAFAAEQINRFDVLVVVETSGDVVIFVTGARSAGLYPRLGLSAGFTEMLLGLAISSV